MVRFFFLTAEKKYLLRNFHARAKYPLWTLFFFFIQIFPSKHTLTNPNLIIVAWGGHSTCVLCSSFGHPTRKIGWWCCELLKARFYIAYIQPFFPPADRVQKSQWLDNNGWHLKITPWNWLNLRSKRCGKNSAGAKIIFCTLSSGSQVNQKCYKEGRKMRVTQ